MAFRMELSWGQEPLMAIVRPCLALDTRARPAMDDLVRALEMAIQTGQTPAASSVALSPLTVPRVVVGPGGKKGAG